MRSISRSQWELLKKNFKNKKPPEAQENLTVLVARFQFSV